MKKTKLKFLLFFALLVLATISSTYAQDGPDGPPPGEEVGPEPPPTAPINQSVPVLAALGVAFAYNHHKKNKF